MKFKVRQLEIKDLKNGFKETLYSRCDEEIENTQAIEQYKIVQEREDYFVYVAASGEKIIATGSLRLDRKFLNNCGIVGRIDDLITRKGYENKNVSIDLVNELIKIAQKKGCYKIVIECKENSDSFFENIGFKKSGSEMKLVISKSIKNNC